jgi:hypothetical protein
MNTSSNEKPDHEINDLRSEKDFKGISFSQFKKTDVCKELLSCLLASKIEQACYWTAEFICAGHLLDLWDLFFFFYGKYLRNPKIVVYLEKRLAQFTQIVNMGFRDNELKVRNHPLVRRMFCEIVCILCLAKRKPQYEEVKIKREDLDMALMVDKFKAPHTQYARDIMRRDDPKELFIGVNEFAYHISGDGKNTVLAFYWFEWILLYEGFCKSKKERCMCERRDKMPVDSKMQMEPVWIIWEALLVECDRRGNNGFLVKTTQALLTLFCVRFTPGTVRRRKFLVYAAISLLTELVDTGEELVKDKDLVAKIVEKIDLVYAQVKVNEVSPQTDYLFMDSKKSNLEKTISKLEKMNQFESTFVPRANGGTDSGHEP